MRLRDVQRIVDAEILCGEEFLDRNVVNAFSADLMSDVLALAKEHSLLLTGLTNIQVIRTAEMNDSIAILFVRGKKPSPETIELAKNNKLPLLATKHLMYTACGLLYKNGLGSSPSEENTT